MYSFYCTVLWCFEGNSMILCVSWAEESLMTPAMFVQAVLPWVLRLQTEHTRILPNYAHLDFFSPQQIRASSDDISFRWHSIYWKCLTHNVFHECTLWSSWQQMAVGIQEAFSVLKRQLKLMLLCRNVYLVKYVKRAFVWDFWT